MLSKLKFAKPIIMVVGDISFAMLIVMCLVLNMQMTETEEVVATTTTAANATITTTKIVNDAPMVNIVILYVLQGIGRACFEGPYVHACVGLYQDDSPTCLFGA